MQLNVIRVHVIRVYHNALKCIPDVISTGFSPPTPTYECKNVDVSRTLSLIFVTNYYTIPEATIFFGGFVAIERVSIRTCSVGV